MDVLLIGTALLLLHKKYKDICSTELKGYAYHAYHAYHTYHTYLAYLAYIAYNTYMKNLFLQKKFEFLLTI